MALNNKTGSVELILVHLPHRGKKIQAFHSTVIMKSQYSNFKKYDYFKLFSLFFRVVMFERSKL